MKNLTEISSEPNQNSISLEFEKTIQRYSSKGYIITWSSQHKFYVFAHPRTGQWFNLSGICPDSPSMLLVKNIHED